VERVGRRAARNVRRGGRRRPPPPPASARLRRRTACPRRKRAARTYNRGVRELLRELDELRRFAGCPASRPVAPPPGRTLAQVVGGRELRCGDGACWELVTPLEQVPQAQRIDGGALAAPLECETAPGRFVALDPSRALLLDVETGGFAGTPVFLIGVVALGRAPLCVEQWLARDYPEERALLRRLGEYVRCRPTWVTFNGKAFDAPFVLERATVHGVELCPPQQHVDLLHVARRRWRGVLRDFRLETLERHVLGQVRVGDVAGCEIPDLFHHFIRTGNAGPLKPVLEHNRLDLLASLGLLLRLARPRQRA